MASLFNKNLQRSCEWCVHSKKSEFSDEILCRKHGVTDRRDYCRNYKYDVLKRTPQKQKCDKKFTPEDFQI